MKRVRKSVLVAYTPRQMCKLVTDIEHYPAFLPWCAQAEVLARSEQVMTARLHMAYRGVKQAFTTQNRHELEPATGIESVDLTLVDGPFAALSGRWQFLPIAAPQGSAAQGLASQSSSAEAPQPLGSRVAFELDYAFANRALELLIAPVFDGIATTLVDAFVQRAEAVHGAT